MASERLDSIQVLRAVAALAVTVAHTYTPIADTALSLGQAVLIPGMVSGAAGVDLFFVISGFLMVYVTRNESSRPLRFLGRRVLRIVPLYWLATLALIFYWQRLGTTAAREGVDVATFITSLLFIVHERPNGGTTPILGQGWSLNYEMFFYVIFAATMTLPRRYALAALFVFLAVAGAWAGYVGITLPLPFGYLFNSFLWEFALGAGIAAAYCAGARLPKGIAAVVGLAGAALLVATFIVPPPFHDRALHWGLPSALVLAGAVSFESHFRTASWRPMVVIGNASYALYLFHGIVHTEPRYSLAWLTTGIVHASQWAAVAYLTALSVVVAIVVHRLVEEPLLRLLCRNHWRRGETIRTDGLEGGNRFSRLDIGETRHVAQNLLARGNAFLGGLVSNLVRALKLNV